MILALNAKYINTIIRLDSHIDLWNEMLRKDMEHLGLTEDLIKYWVQWCRMHIAETPSWIRLDFVLLVVKFHLNL